MEYSLHSVTPSGAFVAVTILPTPARCLSERAAELWAHVKEKDVVPGIVFAPMHRVDSLFGEAAELLHYPCYMNAVLEAALLEFENRSDTDNKVMFLVVPASRVPVSEAAIECGRPRSCIQPRWFRDRSISSSANRPLRWLRGVLRHSRPFEIADALRKGAPFCLVRVAVALGGREPKPGENCLADLWVMRRPMLASSDERCAADAA